MKSGGPPIVIGVGEEFLHDDGAGPAVIAALRAVAHLLPSDTRLEACFGEPTGLIELWRDARLAIVVDAAAVGTEGGLEAGDVLRWEQGDGVGSRTVLRTDTRTGGRTGARTGGSDAVSAVSDGTGTGSGTSPGTGTSSDSDSGTSSSSGSGTSTSASTSSGSGTGTSANASSGSGSSSSSGSGVTIAAGPAATHALGPGAALGLARVLDRLPGRLVMYAVVGTDFSLGPGLSAAVAGAVDTVAADIVAELGREGLSARSDRDLLSWSGGAARPRLKA